MRVNILVNYIAQIYVTIVAIIFLPVYISYLGSAAYGIVAFFSTLQIVFNILDVGLTPTVSRQTVLYTTGVKSKECYFRLIKSICLIFLIVAFSGALVIFVLSNFIAERWLNLEELSIDEVIFSIQLMGYCVAIKWMSGFFRGLLIGREKIYAVSLVNIIVSTLKFIVVIPVLANFGKNLETYFIYQLIISIVEIFSLYVLSSYHLNNYFYFIENKFSIDDVRGVFSFTAGIGFTALVWVIHSQLDKVLLSGILDVSKFGYYTLAVMVAGGITSMTGPISTSLMPRLAALHTSGNYEKFKALYLKFTAYTIVLVGTISLSLFVNAHLVLWLWTGDEIIANESAQVLKYYSLGNLFLALSAFPYYYQYAIGDVRLHIRGTLLSFFLYVPILFVSAKLYGAVGASFAWMSINFLYLSFWVSYSHFSLNRNIFSIWTLDLLVKSFVLPLIAVVLIGQFEFNSLSKLQSIVYIASTSLIIILSFFPLIRKFKLI